MQFDLWSLVILIAAVNGLLISLSILFKDSRQNRMNFMGLALLLLTIQSFWFLYEYLEWYRTYPHLIWVNAGIWYLIGPAIYWHIRQSVKWIDLLHLIPMVAIILIIQPFYSLSAIDKLAYYASAYNPASSGNNYLQYAHLISLSVYVILSWKFLVKKERDYKSTHATSSINDIAVLYTILFMLGLYALLAFLFYGILEYLDKSFMPLDFINMLVLSVLIIYLSIESIYKASLLQIAPVAVTSNGLLKPDHQKQLIAALKLHMSQHRPYLNPDLKLPDLANELEVPLHHLSAAINQSLGKNFFDFINGYRVDDLKVHLSKSEYKHLTHFAIAKEFGFKSNSSFYRIFKKNTGMTPRQYLKSVEKESS